MANEAAGIRAAAEAILAAMPKAEQDKLKALIRPRFGWQDAAEVCGGVLMGVAGTLIYKSIAAPPVAPTLTPGPTVGT